MKPLTKNTAAPWFFRVPLSFALSTHGGGCVVELGQWDLLEWVGGGMERGGRRGEKEAGFAAEERAGRKGRTLRAEREPARRGDRFAAEPQAANWARKASAMGPSFIFPSVPSRRGAAANSVANAACTTMTTPT
jgi:hypothetical protein